MPWSRSESFLTASSKNLMVDSRDLEISFECCHGRVRVRVRVSFKVRVCLLDRAWPAMGRMRRAS